MIGAGWCLAAQPIVELRVALGEIAVQARYGVPRPDVALTFRQYEKADQSGFNFTLEPIPEEQAGTQNSSLLR